MEIVSRLLWGQLLEPLLGPKLLGEILKFLPSGFFARFSETIALVKAEANRLPVIDIASNRVDLPNQHHAIPCSFLSRIFNAHSVIGFSPSVSMLIFQSVALVFD
ncbi:MULTISPECIES: hypothetical protein [unclassified Paraburkholderia]|uniref:hypothetical protein n=1 Tax=unclassified Paraburkholderia TaxID=2615204 RepID=UPI002AB19206|nr:MULTISPECIES: hypothetical protein [unclassified Paraburkholderia]